MTKAQSLPGKTFNPSGDGVDHINIYTKGLTDLGRDLTNMSFRPVALGRHGKFNTLEGWWYYSKIIQIMGENYFNGRMEVHFDLQVGNGYLCKKIGREVLKKASESALKKWSKKKHRELFCKAMRAKVRQHADLKEKLFQSDLPFAHYYFYGKVDNCKVQPANPDNDWMIEEWESIRNDIKRGKF